MSRRLAVCLAAFSILASCQATVRSPLFAPNVFDAIRSAKSPQVQAYLEAGGDPNARDWDGLTPLILAVSPPNPEIAKILIEAGADVNATTPSGESALLAASTGPPEIVRLLLDAGARISEENGLSPLVDAQDEEVVRMLLAAGADPNAKSHRGHTALTNDFYPASARKVGLLIEAGADPNMVDDNGWYPLLFAISRHFRGALDALIGAGADLDVVGDAHVPVRFRPFHQLVEHNNALSMAVQVGKPGFLKKLLDAGADVNGRVTHGATPLMVASRAGDLVSAKLLVNAGADVNARSDHGRTALADALARGHLVVATYLRSVGGADSSTL